MALREPTSTTPFAYHRRQTNASVPFACTPVAYYIPAPHCPVSSALDYTRKCLPPNRYQDLCSGSIAVMESRHPTLHKPLPEVGPANTVVKEGGFVQVIVYESKNSQLRKRHLSCAYDGVRRSLRKKRRCIRGGLQPSKDHTGEATPHRILFYPEGSHTTVRVYQGGPIMTT